MELKDKYKKAIVNAVGTFLVIVLFLLMLKTCLKQ